MRARRGEFQGVKKVRNEFAQRPVAVRGTLQQVFAGEIGKFSDFGLSNQQPRPTDGFVDDREGVTLAALSCGEGYDRVMEQAHQAADIPRSGDIAPFAPLASAREQATDQLVCHVQRRVGQAGFEIDDRSDEDCPPSQRGIARDLMRVGNATLADELPKTAFMDPSGHFRGDAYLADPTKPIEQRPHVIGLRGGWSISQPRERHRVEAPGRE